MTQRKRCYAMAMALTLMSAGVLAQDQTNDTPLINGNVQLAESKQNKESIEDQISNAEKGTKKNDKSAEVGRELEQLQQEHDRKLAKLETELQRKLDKIKAEFERESAKEDKSDKLAKLEAKAAKKEDKAYTKFEEKLAKENARFDEKRNKILSK